MMNLRAELNKLCKPAYLYFVISVFTLLLLVIQNLGNNNRYCLGSFSWCHIKQKWNTGV